MGSHYSVIVIGGGTMGTAAGWALGKRGEKALVLEQFGHIHDQGAHSGQTRVIRHAYTEGAGYVPLVIRADELWMELEAATGNAIYHRVGALEIEAPGRNNASKAKETVKGYDIPYEWLDADEVRRRWPMIRMRDGWAAGYGPRSGFIHVESALTSSAAVARSLGTEIREHEGATAWGATESGVWVETAKGRYTADRLIVAAGAWTAKVLADAGLPLHLLRKVLWWLEVEDESLFQPERFPVFMTDTDFGGIYGFPVWGQPGLKIALHDGGEVTPGIEHLRRTVEDGEKQEVLPLAQAVFPGVTGRVLKSAVCSYTCTPDHDFLVDRHPDHPNVLIAAGFSGHGFKFTPAIGEMLATMSADASVAPLDLFRLGRMM